MAGSPEKRTNTRLQTRYSLDPISGGAGLRNNFVRVVPGAPAPRRRHIRRPRLEGVA